MRPQFPHYLLRRMHFQQTINANRDVLLSAGIWSGSSLHPSHPCSTHVRPQRVIVCYLMWMRCPTYLGMTQQLSRATIKF